MSKIDTSPEALMSLAVDYKDSGDVYALRRALLAVAVEKEVQADQWRPIETAPKDIISRVILWDGEDSEAFAGYFAERHGWVTYPAGFRVYPTHWKPMPGGPKA